MNRTQVACYSLLASAMLLAGLLVTQLGDRMSNTAHGDMVNSQQNVTVMTAATRNAEESLFVLDNSSGALLIYTPDIQRERMNLARVISARRIFAGGGGGGR